jgi:hypothetical protein
MRRNLPLASAEEIRWEGRPAPRCYTFRRWRHSIFGLVFLAICSYWQFLGFEMAETYESIWLAWLPMPFLLLGFYLSIGHLLQSRLEWNHIYYAITDRRLLVQRGFLKKRIESLELSEITYFNLHRQGEQLGTLRVHKEQEKPLTLHCIEHPRRATDLLEEDMGEGPSPNGDCPLRDEERGTRNAEA